MASGSKIVNATFTTAGVVCDALQFSWQENSQSVTNNSTVVGWKLELISYNYGYISSSAKKNWSVTVNGTKYSGTNTIGISDNSSKVLASGTTTIAHNSDGTKSFQYSFSQDFKITFNTYVGTISGSGSGTLTTIARATQPTLSTQTANLGSAITINTKGASSSFTHKVRYEFGSLSGTIGTSVKESISWTIPKSLANEIPFDDRGSGRVFVDTYNGSTLIGTKYSGFTAIVPSTDDFKPKCSLHLTDPTGIYDYYGFYVQGLSKITATISTTIAYGSPITNWSIGIDGKRYSTYTATTGFLTKTGTYLADCLVSDGRGKGTGELYEITVKEYKKPTIEKLSATRCDIDGKSNKRGAYVKVAFSAKVTSLDKKNTATYSIKFKKTSDTEWTKLTANNEVNGNSPESLLNNYAPTNETFIFEASTGSSYDIIATASDRHNATDPTTRNAKAPTGSAIFSWRGFKNLADEYEDGAGIGKVPEKPNTLQVGWDTEFDKAVRGKVYGLGTLTLIPDGSDLNDYIVPGVYSISTDASAGTMTNMPKATAGRLVISDSTGTEPSEDFIWEYKEQLFLPHDIGRGGVPWVRQIRRQKSTQWTYHAWHTYGLFAYPVGAIYISYNHDNPATLFGGTWERIENRFLWATTPGGTIGQTGGEQTHTLTVDEMPSHSHNLNSNLNWDATNGSYAHFRTGSNGNNYGTNNLNTVAVGGGKAHNNMPPYIQVSIWRRTA